MGRWSKLKPANAGCGIFTVDSVGIGKLRTLVGCACIGRKAGILKHWNSSPGACNTTMSIHIAVACSPTFKPRSMDSPRFVGPHVNRWFYVGLVLKQAYGEPIERVCDNEYHIDRVML